MFVVVLISQIGVYTYCRICWSRYYPVTLVGTLAFETEHLFWYLIWKRTFTDLCYDRNMSCNVHHIPVKLERSELFSKTPYGKM